MAGGGASGFGIYGYDQNGFDNGFAHGRLGPLAHLHPHSVHALARVMSLPNVGFPPHLGAMGNSAPHSFGGHPHSLGGHPHSFDAPVFAAAHGAHDPHVFLGASGFYPNDSSAEAAAMAATQTSQHGGVPGAAAQTLFALQSAQLRGQQRQMQGVTPNNNVRFVPQAASFQADQWAAIQATQAVSANVVGGFVTVSRTAAPLRTETTVTSGLLAQSLGHVRVRIVFPKNPGTLFAHTRLTLSFIYRSRRGLATGPVQTTATCVATATSRTPETTATRTATAMAVKRWSQTTGSIFSRRCSGKPKTAESFRPPRMRADTANPAPRRRRTTTGFTPRTTQGGALVWRTRIPET